MALSISTFLCFGALFGCPFSTDAKSLVRRETRRVQLEPDGAVIAPQSFVEETIQSTSNSTLDTPHAAQDECDSALGGRSAAQQSDTSRRFDLPPNAKVIVEFGGNIGEDLAEYAHRFPSARIYSHEPVPEMFHMLEKKFGKNPNIHLNEVGASDADRDATFMLSLDDRAGHFGEGTSGVDPHVHGTPVAVHLKDVDTILANIESEAGPIDVVTVNCEGCEYSILKRMADKGWLDRVPYVQLSWHVADGVKDRVGARCEVEKVLRHSYTPLWYADAGWQAWARSSAGPTQPSAAPKL